MYIIKILKTYSFLLLFILLFINELNAQLKSDKNNLIDKVYASIDKGIEYFYSININGGYVYNYSLDLEKKWGEGVTDDSTIEVQSPGTPAVGSTFLTAYEVTGNKVYLEYALDAAKALISGQNSFGAWDHKIHFNKKNVADAVSFDDNQTQGVIRFLIKLNKYIDDDDLEESIEKALDLLLEAQFENGAWPHYYPKQGNYHDYATFNDGCINDCVNALLDAYKYYKRDKYLSSIERAGNFIYISQLPPPQPGWAQQYNEFLQPVWARTFEPPSVSPLVTLHNVNTLMDIYLVTKNKTLLEPIQDALDWVRSTKLSNGKYPRFVELETGKTLYYDRGRIRVESLDELSVERRSTYGYEQNLSSLIELIETKYLNIKRKNYKDVKPIKVRNYDKIREYDFDDLEERAQKIIEGQDALGRWITKGKKISPDRKVNNYRDDVKSTDRISSTKFNYNLLLLCEYLKLKQQS